MFTPLARSGKLAVIAIFFAVFAPLCLSQVSASSYMGSDCGAKITAADAANAGRSVEIYVDQPCGTSITTSVKPTAGHSLRLVQLGDSALSKNGAFTFTAFGAALYCVPGVTILNGANNAMVTVTGTGVAVRECTIDGGRQIARFSVDSIATVEASGIVAATPAVGGSGHASTQNITSYAQGGCAVVHPEPATTIYLNSSGYASMGAQPLTFHVHVTAEALR